MANYTDEQKQYLKQVGANIRKIRQDVSPKKN